ncbi:hypothetical protein CPT_Percy5 [Caulobacter phage Percy]|uniref:Uncharacterized protein n=1 Tax=Caulobacter phage Percy TaxID=1701809 RepID=A0A0M3UKY2_9CAUD|nr:hypothetical protein CPT_Percy5 [Caulobacter phage Percy]ALF01639.1 hypothetical protein CPT_Percy5 [Caulobacter phage Percy]
MCQHSLAGVRQHLSARGVAIARTDKGYQVWDNSKSRSTADTLPCIDSAYIYGIKLKAVRGGHC